MRTGDSNLRFSTRPLTPEETVAAIEQLDRPELRGAPFFWETTVFDDAESVEERRLEEESGRGYEAQGESAL